MKNPIANFKDRLAEAMQIRNMKAIDLSEKTGIPKSSISQYLSGHVEAKTDRNYLLAVALDVNPVWLSGYDVPMEEIEPTPTQKPKGMRINVYGSVPAGIPIEAIQDIVDREEIPSEWTKGGQEFIALKVIGDSMYPKYMEGDTIIIQMQPIAETGQDCVVYVNGFDATLKTVKFVPEGIQLVPINPAYPPRTYGPGDDPVRILGIVVEIRRKP